MYTHNTPEQFSDIFANFRMVFRGGLCSETVAKARAVTASSAMMRSLALALGVSKCLSVPVSHWSLRGASIIR